MKEPDSLTQVAKTIAKNQKDAKRANKRDYAPVLIERSRGMLGIQEGG